MNISAHEVSELLFHPANFDNDDGTETKGGLPDIKQVSFDFTYLPIQYSIVKDSNADLTVGN